MRAGQTAWILSRSDSVATLMTRGCGGETYGRQLLHSQGMNAATVPESCYGALGGGGWMFVDKGV